MVYIRYQTDKAVRLPVMAGLLAAAFFLAGVHQAAWAIDAPLKLNARTASRLAGLALKCLQKEFPNKLDHVMNDAGEVQSPRRLHPAFYGCFDWHSSVHGHWLLVRMLRLFPRLPEAALIRRVLDQNLAKENLAAETAYWEQANRQSFERTYGWAWLLRLAQELHEWNDADGRRWAESLAPLENKIVSGYRNFFPRQTYPIRTGVHPNTAFALAFGWDYAQAKQNRELAALIRERSLAYFSRDQACPAGWEPGGEDFFSPCLIEADLMRRILPAPDFRKWLDRFLLPASGKKGLEHLLRPATVSDRSDPKIVHLDGLNLSRAWCLAGIASALPPGHPAKKRLRDGAVRLGSEALDPIFSGEYGGEHWLGSFAAYLLSTDWNNQRR